MYFPLSRSMVSMWFGPRRTCSWANGQKGHFDKELTNHWQANESGREVGKTCTILEANLDLEALPSNVKKLSRERRAESGKERTLFRQDINQSTQLSERSHRNGRKNKWKQASENTSVARRHRRSNVSSGISKANKRKACRQLSCSRYSSLVSISLHMDTSAFVVSQA